MKNFFILVGASMLLAACSAPQIQDMYCPTSSPTTIGALDQALDLRNGDEGTYIEFRWGTPVMREDY